MTDTEYLNSIPGMAESILAGMQEPLENCILEEQIKEMFSNDCCQTKNEVVK